MIALDFKHGYGDKIPNSVLMKIRGVINNIFDQSKFSKNVARVVTVDIQNYWLIFEFGGDKIILYSTHRCEFTLNDITVKPGQLMSLSEGIDVLIDFLNLKQKLYENANLMVERMRCLDPHMTDEQWMQEFNKIYADYKVRPILWKEKDSK